MELITINNETSQGSCLSKSLSSSKCACCCDVIQQKAEACGTDSVDAQPASCNDVSSSEFLFINHQQMLHSGDGTLQVTERHTQIPSTCKGLFALGEKYHTDLVSAWNWNDYLRLHTKSGEFEEYNCRHGYASSCYMPLMFTHSFCMWPYLHNGRLIENLLGWLLNCTGVYCLLCFRRVSQMQHL